LLKCSILACSYFAPDGYILLSYCDIIITSLTPHTSANEVAIRVPKITPKSSFSNTMLNT